MPTKVLAVVGSPRHGGNTDLLVDSLIEGARDGGADVEKVFLADLTIAPCDNCDGCRPSAECVVQDDMTPLYDKLMEADVWVLGTPIYWWSVSAQMKAFIDRWYAFGSDGRWRAKGKKAALVSAFEDATPDTARHVVGMLKDVFNYLEMDYLGHVLVTAKKLGEVAGKPEALAEARTMGRQIAGAQ
jgi:multimeric flavodoxin WrbA